MVHVGKVWISVAPDLKGFREKVEKELRSLRGMKVQVNPDLDGFRKEVKDATRGMRATVDVDLDTKGIRSEAKAAAKAASGEVVEMKALLDNSWADKAMKDWKKNFDKRDASGIMKFKVDIDTKDVGNVADGVAQTVSRNPVNITMQIHKDRLNRSLKEARSFIRRQIDADKRHHELGLGTAPRDSGSQRKQVAYLDQIRAKLDKMRATESPWEQWDAKSPLKDFNTDLGNLHKDLSKLKKLDINSYMLGQVGISRERDSLPKLTRQLYDASQAHRELVKRSGETGKAFPDGFQGLTNSLQNLQRELGGTEKQYATFTKRTRDLSKEIGNLVQKRSRKEIYSDKFHITPAITEARKQLKNLNNAYDATAARAQQVNDRIKESTDKTTEALRKTGESVKRVAAPLSRQISLGKSIDPNNTLLGGRGGAIRDAAKHVREYATSLGSLKTIASSTEDSNDKIMRSFRRVNKASSGGFGGKRRRGLKTIDSVGTERFAGLSRMGWMVGAIAAIAAPAVQLISGLAASLPALGGAALAALGVTLLGLDGIKDAAKAAAPALGEAKTAVSDVFRTRMTPQFAQLGETLRAITPSLTKVAHGMSDFSQGMVDSVSSASGVKNINKLLDNTGGLFSRMKPFARDFTDGFLNMAAAGSETFPDLADGMNRFGESFKRNVGELADSGQLQGAIRSTYKVLGSFSTNVGKIIRAGIETAPDMAEGLTGLFDGLGEGIVKIMPLLSSFSANLLPVVGDLFKGIGEFGAAMAPSMETVFDNVGSGLSTFIDGLSSAASTVGPIVGEFIAGLSPLVGTVIGGIGTDLENTAADLEEFAPRLEDSMGRIGSVLGTAPGGWDGNKGFFENLFGKPMFTEAELAAIDQFAADFATKLESMRSQVGEAQGRFKADMDTMKESWKDAFTPETNMELGAKAVVGIAGWWDNFSKLFSKEGRAKLKELSEDPELKIGSALGGADATADADGGGIGEKISTFFSGIREKFAVGSEELKVSTGEIFTGMGESISGAFTGIGEGISSVWTSITTSVTTSVSTMATSVTTTLSSLPASVSSIFSSMGSSMSSAFSSAVSSVTSSASSLVSSVSGTLNSLPGTVSGIFSSLGSTMTSIMASASSSVVSTVSSMVSSAVSVLASLPGRAQGALGNVGGILVASGVALVQGFISGITSMIGRVTAAASQVAAAARSVFPFSPAKKGPLSGKGYTTYSGKALVKDFGKGMISEISVARDSATMVAKATQEEFNKFQLNPAGNMEGFKKQQVLQPVLEANAKRIADWRKREADSAEKLNERLGKINENKSKDAKKSEDVAKAQSDAAKSSAESYQKLLESLDKPDYGKIDRSFRSYWMDGYSEIIRDSILNSMSASNFTGALATSTKGVIKQIREQFGNSPLLSQIEANVDTEAFSWAIHNAVEEAGIAEVPINLVVSNVDQLKSDLGMGDGVLSRALDLAIDYNPANNDARRYEDQKKEVHYHVADMEEAIRLEQQRERKGMMKLR